MDERRTKVSGSLHDRRGRANCVLLGLAAALVSAGTARGIEPQRRPGPPVYEQTDFGQINGLPSNSIRALAVDDDGYLWVGTLGGLARFDGFAFDLVRSSNDEIQTADKVLSLLFDSAGTLWIGTDGGPLVTMRGDTFEAVTTPDMLTSVEDIIESSDGAIWCAGSTLARWHNGDLRIFEHDREDPDRRFRQLAEDSDGAVWAVGSDGLVRLDGEGIEVVDARASTGFFSDPSGALWAVLPSRKAYRIRDPAHVEFDVPFAEVYSELPIYRGQSMLATDAGLLMLRRADDSNPRFRFGAMGWGNREVRSLLGNTRNMAWIGSDRFGLSHVRPRRFTPVDLPSAEPDAAVQGVHRLDAQTALVGAMNHGGSWIVSSTLDAHALLWRDGGPVRAYAATTYVENVAWIATASGLARLDGGQVSRIEGFDQPSKSVVRAVDETVWAHQNERYVEVLPDGTPGRETADIGREPHGATPVAGGFLCISDEAIVHVNTTNATTRIAFDLRGVTPRAIAIDGRGTLWVTTYGSGLFRRLKNGHVDQWTTVEGLPDDFLAWIGVMLDSNGREFVWMNSNRGLIRVEVESLECVELAPDDGLRSLLIECGESNGPSAAILGNGLILLPTLVGLVAVEQNQLGSAQPPPQVAVEWVEIDGHRLSRSSSPRGSADLAFGYTAIQFPRSTDARFQYRLDDYDSAWNEAEGERAARYTNIPPGHYTFRVRAQAAGGPWSEAVAASPIAVSRLWHQQRLNQILLVIGFVAMLGLAYVARTRDLRHRSRALASEVDQRRRAEDQLRSSEANYISVLDSALDGIVMVEADGTIGLANAAMCRMIGYTREELTGRSATWLRMPDHFDPAAEWVRADPEGPPSTGFRERRKTRNFVIPRKDGSLLDVELSVAQETFRDRPRLVGIVRDVSERRRMTDRLRESEQRYQQLFRTAPTAIVAWQPDRRIIDWNERAAELFNWSTDAAPTLTQLFAPSETGDVMREAVDAVLNGRRDAAVIYPTRIGAKDERRCRWTFAPITGANGGVHTVISLVTDVTEDERIAQDMESLRRKLARAEETERSRIARELHDDLSQRLAALAIEMQLLENGIEQRPLKVLARAIRSVHTGLDEVSTDVHVLSHQLHPTVLDDLGLPRALRSECQRRRRAAGISLRFVDDSGEMDVRDEIGLALFRIAQESIQNAIKHASAQEIVVRLAADPDSIELTISDDGVGFHAERYTSGSGGGLGLASVQERARLIGADIEFRTAPGEGTVVSVTLALRAEKVAPARLG